jgi:hypothetical protein
MITLIAALLLQRVLFIPAMNRVAFRSRPRVELTANLASVAILYGLIRQKIH